MFIKFLWIMNNFQNSCSHNSTSGISLNHNVYDPAHVHSLHGQTLAGRKEAKALYFHFHVSNLLIWQKCHQESGFIKSNQCGRIDMMRRYDTYKIVPQFQPHEQALKLPRSWVKMIISKFPQNLPSIGMSKYQMHRTSELHECIAL